MRIFDNRLTYNILRHFAMKKITSNLGKLVEEDDKIICYVDKNRCNKELYKYNICCFGTLLKDKELAKKYDINKPICYVFDSIDFDNHEVYIYGHDDSEIIIRNSYFKYGLCIGSDGKVSIENSSIKTSHTFSMYAKELILKDINIVNDLTLANFDLQITLEGNSIDMINTNIGKENEKTSVFLMAKDSVNMVNSTIKGEFIKCESKKIDADTNSSFVGSEKVKLKTQVPPRLKIASKSIIYNNNVFSNQKKKIVLDNPFAINRLRLIQTLRKISDACKAVNDKEVEEYRNSLSNNSVIKTLKNK